MQENINISFCQGVLTAKPRRDLDHHTAKPIREKIDREIFNYKPRVLVIDFSSVGFMDSSGIGLILGRVDLASALGATVRVCGLSDSLMKLLRLSGLDRVKNLTVMKSI